MTFRPNYLQLKHIAERGENRYNLILKYRQGGVTTLYEIDELDEALWVPGMTCGIIAHEAKKLPEYFNIIKLAFQYLPESIKPKTKTDTKMMYEFTHRFDGAPLNSSIYVSTDVRGGTVQKLHITESAYIKDRQKLKSGSKQAVPLTGSISEETTGNGFNEFYDEYMEALERKNPAEQDYHAYFYAWVENHEYTLPGTIDSYTPEEENIKQVAKELYNINVTDGQLLWRRWKKNELKSKDQGSGLSGDQLFKQEYPLTIIEAFQSGAGNCFDSEKIEALQGVDPLTPEQAYEWIAKTYPVDDIYKLRYEQLHKLNVHFWDLPVLGRKYNVGVDPSDGEGSDCSCIDIWDDETDTQVAQFYGKVRPDDLAELTKLMAEFYNHAYTGIENNMLSTILFFVKIYDNYYYESKYDEKIQKRTKKIGWSTNVKTRDVMIDDFVKFFEEDLLHIRSKITIKEMRTFVKNPESGKREHAAGKHDDSLFAAFIAIQMKKFNKPKARAFARNPYN